MFASLHGQLLTLPEVWPGHLGGSLCGGPGMDMKVSSTIAYELAHAWHSSGRPDRRAFPSRRCDRPVNREHVSPSRAQRDRARAQQPWLGAGWLPLTIESLEQLDLLLVMVAKSRVVHRDGIRFQGLRYLDPTLAAYVGERVTIRDDPRDMAEIRVFHRNRFLCRAISPEHAGETISLKDIQAARPARRRALRNQLDDLRKTVGEYLPAPRLHIVQDPTRPRRPPADASRRSYTPTSRTKRECTQPSQPGWRSTNAARCSPVRSSGRRWRDQAAGALGSDRFWFRCCRNPECAGPHPRAARSCKPLKQGRTGP